MSDVLYETMTEQQVRAIFDQVKIALMEAGVPICRRASRVGGKMMLNGTAVTRPRTSIKYELGPLLVSKAGKAWRGAIFYAEASDDWTIRCGVNDKNFEGPNVVDAMFEYALELPRELEACGTNSRQVDLLLYQLVMSLLNELAPGMGAVVHSFEGTLTLVAHDELLLLYRDSIDNGLRMRTAFPTVSRLMRHISKPVVIDATLLVLAHRIALELAALADQVPQWAKASPVPLDAGVRARGHQHHSVAVVELGHGGAATDGAFPCASRGPEVLRVPAADVMTIEELLKRRLYEVGMFDDQIAVVMGRVKAGREAAAVAGRWGERADAYPEGLIRTLWVVTRRAALVFIDETCPEAWFRPLLAGEKDE